MTQGIADLIYRSDQLATQHVQIQEKIQADPGFTWNIPEVDRYVIPARGGDVSLIVGRPGHGKSTALAYLALTEALRILDRGAEKEETAVYATWEGTVDDIYAGIVSARAQGNPELAYSSTDYWWGRVDIEDVRASVTHYGVLPLTMVGFSTLRKSKARLTLDTLFEVLAGIEGGMGDEMPKRKIKLFCGDYLQIIPVDGARDKIDTVSRAITGCKKLGIHFDIPSFLGAQAGRAVDTYAIKLPMDSDIQWSSAGEQAADKLFGVWMPWKTETETIAQAPEGQIPTITVYGTTYPLSNRTFFLEMRKQRKDQGRRLWCLNLAPELLRLAAMEFDVDRVDIDQMLREEGIGGS